MAHDALLPYGVLPLMHDDLAVQCLQLSLLLQLDPDWCYLLYDVVFAGSD